MPMTTVALRVLGEYVARVQASGKLEKVTISNAVKLTSQQQADLQQLLVGLWKRADYLCPANVDLKPRHGYNSRVIKDQFTGQQYIDWLEAGCSDAAVAGAAADGSRIHLGFGPMGDYPNITYQLVVPIRSDFFGSVHIDDVIPDGLPAGAKK
ncbi:hypothetical protein ACFOLJ_09710 [Rugamonas sp. CCM 8940]|uniref:hypothetical protein n=1 Tax=Rugamonas sp. CCM 8940 TaxID=2765359 RepID=UPI0018F2CB0A|nr:hypothetical protein [Rugamonas sp. CCM 8940]MBJ7309614.1 hypothetical protein [Rugamonas sp. CCM 8940]